MFSHFTLVLGSCLNPGLVYLDGVRTGARFRPSQGLYRMFGGRGYLVGGIWVERQGTWCRKALWSNVNRRIFRKVLWEPAKPASYPEYYNFCHLLLLPSAYNGGLEVSYFLKKILWPSTSKLLVSYWRQMPIEALSGKIWVSVKSYDCLYRSWFYSTGAIL